MLKPGDTNRRDMLRSAMGDWLERLMARTEERVVSRKYFRPPGALPEIGFLAACTRCGACADTCPPHAIVSVSTQGGLAAGTPYLDFETKACSACVTMPCAAACPTAALTVPPNGWSDYRLTEVEFYPERCLTFKGMACRLCVEACPVGEAALVIDEGGHPVLRRESCVGCGACASSCPTNPSSFELAHVAS
jgi:MauM/NapG family ferredoxin protein